MKKMWEIDPEKYDHFRGVGKFRPGDRVKAVGKKYEDSWFRGLVGTVQYGYVALNVNFAYWRNPMYRVAFTRPDGEVVERSIQSGSLEMVNKEGS